MADEVGAANAQKIMHARFQADGIAFMASDDMFGASQGSNAKIALSLATNDAAQGERTFNALSDGGTVTMPLGDVFWGGRFGMLTDRYGVAWMLSINP